MPETTLTLLYTERFGAADRILSLLRRRGFPIGGITMERTHLSDVGRMTVVVEQAAALEQVSRHLRKLPDVIDVTPASSADSVQREFALARVSCRPQQRAEVMALLAAYGAQAASMTGQHIVVEVSGTGSKLDALFTELQAYGIEDLARTNPLAMRCFPVSAESQAEQNEIPAAQFA